MKCKKNVAAPGTRSNSHGKGSDVVIDSAKPTLDNPRYLPSFFASLLFEGQSVGVMRHTWPHSGTHEFKAGRATRAGKAVHTVEKQKTSFLWGFLNTATLKQAAVIRRRGLGSSTSRLVIGHNMYLFICLFHYLFV